MNKKIKFYCSWCGIPYEYELDKCTMFTLKNRSFLRQIEHTFVTGPCPKCGYKNVEEIRSKKNEKNTV